MLLSRSFTRKVVATCGAALGFTLLYEARMFDSRTAGKLAEERQRTARPAPGVRVLFDATAYCKGDVTAAGTSAQRGVAAADPSLLPVGSVVHIDSLGPKYNGIYTVMDTGPAVAGREIDLYMWNCNEALAFGRRSVALTVLRLGWSPTASATGGGLASLLRRREQDARPPAPDPQPAPEPVPSAPPVTTAPAAPEAGTGSATPSTPTPDPPLP